MVILSTYQIISMMNTILFWKVFQTLRRYLSISLRNWGWKSHPDIIAQIFISFIQNNLFLDPQEFFNSLEENSEARYSYQLLSQILERLSKQYKITFTNHDELIWHLHNTALFERQEIFSTPILFEQKALTIKKI